MLFYVQPLQPNKKKNGSLSIDVSTCSIAEAAREERDTPE